MIVQKIDTYNKIKISRKRLSAVSDLLRLQNVSIALEKLLRIRMFKLRTKDNKYPLYATQWLYSTLTNIKKSIKANLRFAQVPVGNK